MTLGVISLSIGNNVRCVVNDAFLRSCFSSVRLNLSLLRSVRRGLAILDHDVVEGPRRVGGRSNHGANRKSEKKKWSTEGKGRQGTARESKRSRSNAGERKTKGNERGRARAKGWHRER